MNENAGCQSETPTLHRLLNNIGGLSQELLNLASETTSRVNKLDYIPEPLKSNSPTCEAKQSEPVTIVEKLQAIERTLEIAKSKAEGNVNQLNRLVGI